MTDSLNPEENGPVDLVKLRIAGSLNEAAEAEIVKQLESGDSWQIERDLADLRAPLKSLDPSILPIVKIAIAVAALGYTVVKDWKNASTWTAQRLHDHLSNELTAKGIVGFEVSDANNFDAFRKGKELCVVNGFDKKGKTYKVWLFLDGQVAVLKISKEDD